VSGGKDIMKFGDKMEGHSRAYQAVSVSTGRCTFSRQFVAYRVARSCGHDRFASKADM
jgi:hypothetical protein